MTLPISAAASSSASVPPTVTKRPRPTNQLHVLAIFAVGAELARRTLGLEDWARGGYLPLGGSRGGDASSTGSAMRPGSTQGPVGTDAWLLPGLRDLVRGEEVRWHRRGPSAEAGPNGLAHHEHCSFGGVEIRHVQCWLPPGDPERTWLVVHLRVPCDSDDRTDELETASRLLRDLVPRATYQHLPNCLFHRLAADGGGVATGEGMPPARCAASAAAQDPILEHKGLLVFAHGPRFHQAPPPNLALGTGGGRAGGRPWTPESQWLWWLSECLSTRSRNQHGMPISIEQDVTEFEGHLLYVGARATVLVDDPAQHVRFDRVWENQFDVLLTDAMVLATYQRDRLYLLANHLIVEDRASRADLRALWRQLSEFRRSWWWVSVGVAPDNSVLQSYQRAHRLPELMDQLVHEVHDYREHEELRMAAILNWSVAAFAILSVAGAVGELASGYGALGRTWAVALIAATGAAVLVVLSVLRSRNSFRRR